jgi:hypothetical protein
MPEDAPNKPIRGYVSSYLKLPVRPLDQAQRDRETKPIDETPAKEDKKSKD